MRTPLRPLLALPAAALLVASCADDPALSFGSPPTPEATKPDARNYCAIVGACELFPDFGFGECINELVRTEIELAPFGDDLGLEERYQCVEAAGTDCALAQACIGRIATTDPRCTDPASGEPYPGQSRAFCDGDRITACNAMGNAAQTFGCADDFARQKFGGPDCVANADASALCGFALCEGSPETGYPAPTCDENTLIYCTNGVEQRQNCAVFGGKCDVGQGKCVDTCELAGFVCKGDVLVKQCTDGSELSVYDCSVRAGWTCRAPGSPTAFGCAPPNDECAWGTYVAECVDGVQIQFCDDGKLSLYDCRDMGATGCEQGSAGVNCKL
jgi:hypothetical protein